MLLLISLLTGLAAVSAQVNKNDSLTPDVYYHNRYHAKLSMAAYGDFNTTCPNQTFTEASMLLNFPNSKFPPWTVVNTFGPTASGAAGFTAVVPEMNKALIVFKGNTSLEQTLPTDVVGWDQLNPQLFGICNWFGKNNGFPGQNCTMNEFALQGYLEAKAETNDWAAIKQVYTGAGLVFSITGHGLGGMHGLIAAIDLNHQNISYYSHAYGTPRTFNGPGAWYYNYNFWGESGERGINNNDMYTEYIPESANYTHAGTPFRYSGYNNTALGPNMDICFDVTDPTCQPQQTVNSTIDHFWYFTRIGQCGGGSYSENATETDAIAEWLAVNDQPSTTTGVLTLTDASSSAASSAMSAWSSIATVSSIPTASAFPSAQIAAQVTSGAIAMRSCAMLLSLVTLVAAALQIAFL